MEQIPRDARIICAHLLRQGYIRKNSVPTLEVDEHLFNEVQKALSQVGMELVYNAYSPYYAVRLTPEAQETVDQSNNLGLKNNEIAMLVILWSKLILPKRLNENASALKSPVSEENIEDLDIPADSDSLEEGETEASKTQDHASKGGVAEERKSIYIKLNELSAEFGAHFGSRTAFKAILTRLSNLQFIRIHNEVIAEGILLDLLVDGYRMANEIKKSALAFKLAGILDEWEEDENWDEDEVSEEGSQP